MREWLKSLEAEDRRAVGEDIKDGEFYWPIGVPLVRALGNELWEVRSSLPRGGIARVLFCVIGEQMVLLQGFIKKTQKTPKREIDLALKRKKGESGQGARRRGVLRRIRSRAWHIGLRSYPAHSAISPTCTFRTARLGPGGGAQLVSGSQGRNRRLKYNPARPHRKV